MPLELAIGLSALASALLSLGLYLMKLRAPELPALGSGFRWTTWRAFLRDKLWLSGLLLQTFGYALYFAVLRYAPLSLVHTALTGGLVLFLLLAVFWLGEHAGVREWAGGLLVTAGLVLLGLSLDEQSSHGPSPVYLGGFVGACALVAALALVLDRQPHRPVGTSIASGLLLGLAAVFAKLLATTDSFTRALSSAPLWLTLGANIGGFALMQSALQNGRGVVVVPIFAMLSDVVPIVAGIILFGETLPREQPEATFRLLAFVLALTGGGLLATTSEPHHRAARPKSV